MKVAVIGAGISGITASHYLQQFTDVTLFESANKIGGHANTVSVADDKVGFLNVDTGFIVYNDRNYPGFSQFLSELQVDSVPTNMTFSYSNQENGFSYAGSVKGLFPDLKGLFDVRRLLFMRDIVKYSKHLRDNVSNFRGRDVIMVDALREAGCPDHVISQYFIPITGAIWSCGNEDAAKLPVDTFINFFDNHGLFSLLNRPNWFSVKGGSQAYLEVFKRYFKGSIFCNAEVQSIQAADREYMVRTSRGSYSQFNYVVFATHANVSLDILRCSDYCNTEVVETLNSYKYTQNEVILHEDGSFLPDNRRLWASWNVKSMQGHIGNHRSHTTYYMNKLQRLVTDRKMLVTVNPISPPREETVIKRFIYSHPIMSSTPQDSNRKARLLNRHSGIYFCGAYTGYGFHEDGYQSGLQVVEAIKKHRYKS